LAAAVGKAGEETDGQSAVVTTACETWAGEMDTFEPPKYITSLIAAINDGAKSAQTGAFAFAAIGLYLLATAFSATDEDLLLDRILAISQLSAQIPATVSFE
jgi:hypothetical protein